LQIKHLQRIFVSGKNMKFSSYSKETLDNQFIPSSENKETTHKKSSRIERS